MAIPHQESPQTFGAMSQQQLELYAIELYNHVREEQRLRSELEVRNEELQQRINELTSLNRLFQGFMREYFAFTQSYQRIAAAAQRLADDAQELSRRVRPQSLSELIASPALSEDS